MLWIATIAIFFGIFFVVECFTWNVFEGLPVFGLHVRFMAAWMGGCVVMRTRAWRRKPEEIRRVRYSERGVRVYRRDGVVVFMPMVRVSQASLVGSWPFGSEYWDVCGLSADYASSRFDFND